jgi:alpha-1,3-glucan synthase
LRCRPSLSSLTTKAFLPRRCQFANTFNDTCQLPVFWGEDGYQLTVDQPGCYASEFDQYGDMEAFGVHPDWQRQLSKFSSVQDRLREWDPVVMAKIQRFSCMAIKALDIDAIRIDKATQVTVGGLSSWASHTRDCAIELGKTNFFISGEVTGGNVYSSLYMGRGRTPSQKPATFDIAVKVNTTDDVYFIRGQTDGNALDGVACHYSIYRGLTRFLGMDGNLAVAYDIDVNFISAYNQMVLSNDFINPGTGKFDVKHMYGIGNFDVFRWGALEFGVDRSALASFITTLLLPGIPLAYYGDEQGMYVFDNGASNYLYGRQPMASSTAWQRHGCYHLGSDQYYNMPLEKSLIGCEDPWNSLDHFDPTSMVRRQLKQFHHLRALYPSLQDGMNLVQFGNWTRFVQLPGSNLTQTELGLWSAARSAIPDIENEYFENFPRNTQVWLLYTNENQTQPYEYDCGSKQWISTPFQGGDEIRNIIYPYDNITLSDSRNSYFENGTAPWRGCLPQITMNAYSYRAYVPIADWMPQAAAMTRFLPGHDARILSNDTLASVDITIEYNTPMDCQSLQNAISFSHSNTTTGTPQLTAVECNDFNGPRDGLIYGVDPSAWQMKATITNIPDGILEITVGNVTAQDVRVGSTGVRDHLQLRKGKADNPLVFPENDYNNAIFSETDAGFLLQHTAIGADIIRYTWNYGQNWTDWFAWEAETVIDKSVFALDGWQGHHVIVQYWSETASAQPVSVHADIGYSHERRVPAYLARGPFNNWGYDQGVSNQMVQSTETPGEWSLQLSASWPTIVQLCVSVAPPPIAAALTSQSRPLTHPRPLPSLIQLRLR